MYSKVPSIRQNKTKLKPVLGHRWVEVVGGIIWGLFVAYIFYLVK